ncbi:MAG: virginiamycin B lyase family protein [Pseudomonadota bacterium]
MTLTQRLALAALPLALMLPPAPAPAQDGAIPIEEWEIEAGGRPRDPYASGPDTVWFAGQAGDYLGRLTPSTGEVAIRELEDDPGPHNLIVGEDGAVWYSGNLAGYIGRYDPASDSVERIEMPDPEAGDPHTLIFDADRSHIWFTVQIGNFVGRLSLADRAVELIEIPTPNARPYGIRTAPDGTVWVALLGTNALASVDPESLELTTHPLPHADARPRRLEVTSEGVVWYADYRRGAAGWHDPASGEAGEVSLPGGADSRPYGTAMDADDTLWIVETGPEPNRMVAVDTAAREVARAAPIPSGAGAVRHMHYFAPGREVWFGSDADTIGRVRAGGS